MGGQLFVTRLLTLFLSGQSIWLHPHSQIKLPQSLRNKVELKRLPCGAVFKIGAWETPHSNFNMESPSSMGVPVSRVYKVQIATTTSKLAQCLKIHVTVNFL